MTILLDTCAVIWATLAPGSLSAPARRAIGNEENAVMVSAVSAWEIATKVRLGKLTGAEELERNYLDVMDDAGYTLLAIDTEAALRAGRLAADHRDPFDRMIAAQALALDIPVVSPDVVFEQFGVRRLW